MTMKRVVDSVALIALLPVTGVIACGSQGDGGNQPAPSPTFQLPPGYVPPGQGPGPGGPPIIGSQPPPSGTTPTSPTSTAPVPTSTGPNPNPFPTSTTPTPTPTGPIPTSTVPTPTPTGPVPTSTAPVPTATTPAPSSPPPAYDANGVLLPPDPSIGMQIATPQFSLPPGSEQFKCYTTTLQTSTETDVHRWVSQMTPGSHHFILYVGGANADGLANNGCTVGGPGSAAWVYASSQPDNQMPMPDGVAMPLTAAEKLNFDMHYINTGSNALNVQILLNIEKIQSANFQRAGALVSFNTGIFIPPMGTQTVTGSCAVPAGSNFFILSTHTHKHATLASITDQGTGTELVHTTDWENPDTKVYLNAPFYNFKGRLGYSCSYQSDSSAYITVGTSAIKNEMCMAVTYFFPAPSGSMGCQ